MRELLEDIFEELAHERAHLSERDFSRDWLGKSETYFAYLKSAGKQPSATAILNLWRKLKREKRICQEFLVKSDNNYYRSLLNKWSVHYDAWAIKLMDDLVKERY